MKSNSFLVMVFILSLVCAVAQTPSSDPAKKTNETQIIIELRDLIDAKNAKVGDAVSAHIMDNVILNGVKIAPSGTSKLVGHVNMAQASTADKPSSTLGVIFDKIVLKDGHEIPVNVVVLQFFQPLPSAPHTVSVVDTPMARSADRKTDDMGFPTIPSSPPTQTMIVPGTTGVPAPAMTQTLKVSPEVKSSGVVVTSKTHSAKLDPYTRFIVKISTADK